ncbi:hypothetical protein VDR65_01765 [Xanthomonas campestris pv. campestris]|nr:hypothetical protein [Xanthomonas campestris pv. campestris]
MIVWEAAKRLGVDKKTAFRWCHQFLETMIQMSPTDLSGIMEADENFSRKVLRGRKKMPRPVKHRGEPA